VAGLAIFSVALQAACAALLGLDGFAWKHLATAASDSLLIAATLYFTLPIVAWLAVLGKGYLPPMMFSAVAASAGLVLGVVGWGRWFPWAMGASVSGTFLGPMLRTPTLVTGSWVVEATVFVAGIAAVILYIDRADNLQ
jgi:hypothetical protein